MALQATVIDGIASAFGNATALFIGIATAAVLYLWLDPVLQLSDAGIPWRQLTQNRNLGGIVLSCRTFCTILKYRLGICNK